MGRAAKDRLVVAPDSGRAFFKRDMGTPTTYRFAGTDVDADRVLGRRARRAAARGREVPSGVPVTDAVITVPAYFHEPQRQATLDAARIAGLRCAGILNEPTAAALAFGRTAPVGDRRLLVFDLGGGTFDVTLLETFEGIIEVKASGGDGRLGGEDFTDALLEIAVANLGRVPTREERARWRQKVEVAKRRLSTAPTADVDLGGRIVTLSRDDLIRAGAPILARIRPVAARCLRDAGVTPEQLTDVLFVGGASRMPAVVELARSVFGREPNRELDPDRVVALGAAVQAALVDHDDAVKDLVLTDVCPHSLGVEISKRIGSEITPGYFEPLLDRNVIVPISRSGSFRTWTAEQDTIDLKIVQGESRRTQENTLLGRLKITGLRAKGGHRLSGCIEVRFSYDANGILEVEATILHSGEKRRLVIESRPGALTPEQVEQAVRRLQPLKTHPRDQARHRARLERGNRLFSDRIGHERDLVGHVLDAFEAALASQDEASIEEAGARLDELIAGAYGDEGEDRDPWSVES